MLQSTITSIIAFHHKSATVKAKHAVAIKLLQDDQLYDYLVYIAKNNLRHPIGYRLLLKEVKEALKYDASCMIVGSKLIAV